MKLSELKQIIKEEIENAMDPSDETTYNNEPSMDFTIEDSKRIIGGLLYDDFVKLSGLDPMDIIWVGMYPDSADIQGVLDKSDGTATVIIAYIKKSSKK
jgi:hypothetical protein